MDPKLTLIALLQFIIVVRKHGLHTSNKLIIVSTFFRKNNYSSK